MVLPRSQILRFHKAALCLAAFSIAPAMIAQSAAGGIAPGLVKRSPFLPPDHTPPPTRTEAVKPAVAQGSYEFRGFYSINGKLRMLVKNKAEQAGTWLRLNEPQNGRTVKEFDAKARSILLDADGNEMRLQLVTLDSNSTPIPINGQNAGGSRQVGAVGAAQPGQITPTVIRRGSPTPSNPAARRRVAPARPQWLQDRLNAQTAAAGLQGRNDQGGPNFPTSPADLFTPGPPPTMLPPTPAPTGVPELPDFLNVAEPPASGPDQGIGMPSPDDSGLPPPPNFPGGGGPPF